LLDVSLDENKIVHYVTSIYGNSFFLIVLYYCQSEAKWSFSEFENSWVFSCWRE